MPPFADGASDDDERLVERLRAKYSHRHDGPQHDQGSGQGAPAPAGPGSEPGGAGERGAAHARVCGVCNGEGRTQTVYNHRVLQSNCEHCGGQGVLLVTEPGAASGSTCQAAVEKPRRPAPRGVEQLRADVAAIEARLEAYRQELMGVQRHLDSGVGGAEGAALARQLADELESHITRLEASRQTRLRALAG